MKQTFIALAVAIFASLPAPTPAANAARQAEVWRRGSDVMPFRLDTTTHVFTKTAQGGVQRMVAKNAADTAQVRLVRRHLREIESQFRRGDFSGPQHIHGKDMPGLAELNTAPRRRHSQRELAS